MSQISVLLEDPAQQAGKGHVHGNLLEPSHLYRLFVFH